MRSLVHHGETGRALARKAANHCMVLRRGLTYWAGLSRKATGERREVASEAEAVWMSGSQLGWATFAESCQAPSELNNLGVITSFTSAAELGQKLGTPLGDLLDEQEKGPNSRIDLPVAA